MDPKRSPYRDQGLLYAFATGSMLSGMRVGPTSPMRAEAANPNPKPNPNP